MKTFNLDNYPDKTIFESNMHLQIDMYIEIDKRKMAQNAKNAMNESIIEQFFVQLIE